MASPEDESLTRKKSGLRKKLLFSPRAINAKDDSAFAQVAASVSLPDSVGESLAPSANENENQRKRQLLLLKRTRSGPLTPLEKLEQAYVEKEEEAILAAHIGQKLLQKVNEDQRIIQELKTENEGKTSEIAALYTDMDKLDSQIAALKKESKGENKVTDLERKCQEIESLCSLLRRSIEETERVNRNLLAQISEKESEVRKVSETAKENEKFRIKFLEISEEIESLKEKYQFTEETLKAKLQSEISQKNREIEDLRKSLKSSTAADSKPLVTMTSSSPAAAAVLTVSSDSSLSSAQQLSTARKEKQELMRELECAKLEYQKLSEAIAILVKENESLHKDRDESNALLEEHRDIVTMMRTQIEELKLLLSSSQTRRSSTPSSSFSAADPNDLSGTSLAEELIAAATRTTAGGGNTGDASLTQQMDLIEDLKRSVHSISQSGGRPGTPQQQCENVPAAVSSSSSSSAALVASSSSRSIPRATAASASASASSSEPSTEFQNIREYFFLASAAMKVHIATRHPESSHLVFQIDVNDCYHQAIREKVPFHEWHSWILSTFLNRFNEKQVEESQKKSEVKKSESVERSLGSNPTQRTTRSNTAPPLPSSSSASSSTPTKNQLTQSSSSSSSSTPTAEWKCACGISSKRAFCPKCNGRPK